jgi:predicted ATPase
VLNLPPMNDVHARQLLSNLDPESALDEVVVELLVRRSDGIPLFIEECFRAIVESSASSTGILDVPQRLQGVIWYRLDQLGEFKRIAQLASVCGQTFSLEILEEAVRRIAGEADPLPRLQAAINALERAELISIHPEPGRRRFRFRHALIHTAAYESLWSDRRRD